MCGIVGGIVNEGVLDYLVTGLKRLEYRGYDSAGVSTMQNGKINYVKSVGKIKELEKKLKNNTIDTNIGIGHTRWATHGKVSEENAHPHIVGSVSIVHNGIIENYKEIKEEFNIKANSETDTEVVAYLLDMFFKETKDPLKTVKKMSAKLEGMFSLGIIFAGIDKIYAVRSGSPLVVGKNDSESFLASDTYPMIDYADSYTRLEENQIAVLSKNNIEIFDWDLNLIEANFKKLDIAQSTLSKGNYKYYMEKEIYEQVTVFMDTIQDRISNDRKSTDFRDLDLKPYKRIHIVACGTAWHAGLMGKYYIEEFARIPVDIEVASEFRYRNPILSKETLIIFISQSGETADTLAALKQAKSKGIKTLAICNRPDSSLDREADYTVLTRAGMEIGVAATKSFLTQMGIIFLLALEFAKQNNSMEQAKIAEILKKFVHLPVLIEKTFKTNTLTKEAAQIFRKIKRFMFLGRGFHYPIALEGALKLKEITYISAEGYPAGELKHGPIALVDDDLVAVAIAPKDRLYNKTINGIEEIVSRSGKILAIGTEGDSKLKELSDVFISIPDLEEIFLPFIEIIPIQFFALNMAIAKGTDVDNPRNLAKSVTVE